VLGRSLEHKANVINALQLAADRGLNYAERHEGRSTFADSVMLELDTDTGVVTAEGAVVFDRPRLMRLDGIHCEMLLEGDLLYLMNEDVPGVVGFVGNVLGQNNINIANFSLGRSEKHGASGSRVAVAIIETDGPVPEAVLHQLVENPAVHVARTVAFRA